MKIKISEFFFIEKKKKSHDVKKKNKKKNPLRAKKMKTPMKK